MIAGDAVSWFQWLVYSPLLPLFGDEGRDVGLVMDFLTRFRDVVLGLDEATLKMQRHARVIFIMEQLSGMARKMYEQFIRPIPFSSF